MLLDAGYHGLYCIFLSIHKLSQEPLRQQKEDHEVIAMPGLKAKLSIIFIVCSNKIYNRVMLRDEGDTFFVHCVHLFAVVLNDHNVKAMLHETIRNDDF